MCVSVKEEGGRRGLCIVRGLRESNEGRRLLGGEGASKKTTLEGRFGLA